MYTKVDTSMTGLKTKSQRCALIKNIVFFFRYHMYIYVLVYLYIYVIYICICTFYIYENIHFTLNYW